MDINVGGQRGRSSGVGVQGFTTPESVISSCGCYYYKAGNYRGLRINSAAAELSVAE